MSRSENLNSIVDRIFTALGGPTKIAAGLSVPGAPVPVQTVHSWKSAAAIPKWRRAAVMDLARRGPKPLDPEAISYLMANVPAQAAGG